jgi:hypothetical protein
MPSPSSLVNGTNGTILSKTGHFIGDRNESRDAARPSNDRRLKRVSFDLCTDVAGFAAP